MREKIVALHKAYLAEVGLDEGDMPLTQWWERCWYSFLKDYGMTLEDLKIGLAARSRAILAGTHTKACRKLSNIINDDENLARFQEDVALEKQRRRAKEQIRAKVATRMQDVHEASVREFERKFYNQ